MSDAPIPLNARPLPNNLNVEATPQFLGTMCAAIIYLQDAVANLENIMVEKGLATRPVSDPQAWEFEISKTVRFPDGDTTKG